MTSSTSWRWRGRRNLVAGRPKAEGRSHNGQPSYPRARTQPRTRRCSNEARPGFTLTEAGLRLLQYAEGMENNANAIMERVVGAEKADAVGAVRIASMEGIGSMYLTKCMADFNKVYPSIQVELITDTRLLDMTRREADIFVSFFRPKGRRFSVKKIGDFQDLSVRLERLSAAAIREPADLKDLDNARVHRFHRRAHPHQGKSLAFRYSAGRAHVVFKSTSLVSQFVAVSSGLGIAMLPSYVAAHNKDLRPGPAELFFDPGYLALGPRGPSAHPPHQGRHQLSGETRRGRSGISAVGQTGRQFFLKEGAGPAGRTPPESD